MAKEWWWRSRKCTTADTIGSTWFSPPEEGPAKEKGSSSPGCRIRGWKIKINISIFLGLRTDRPGCIKTVDYRRRVVVVVVGVQEKVTTLFWHFLRPTKVHVPGPVLHRRGFATLANQSSKRRDGEVPNQPSNSLPPFGRRRKEWRVVVVVLFPPWQYQKRKSEVQFPRYKIICELCCSSSPAKDDDIHFSRATNSSIFSCLLLRYLLTCNAPLANPLVQANFSGATRLSSPSPIVLLNDDTMLPRLWACFFLFIPWIGCDFTVEEE